MPFVTITLDNKYKFELIDNDRGRLDIIELSPSGRRRLLQRHLTATQAGEYLRDRQDFEGWEIVEYKAGTPNKRKEEQTQ